MAGSGHPGSPTDRADEKVGIRVAWTRFGVVFAATGSAFFLVGMWRMDGAMAAIGLAAWLVLAFAVLLGVWNLRGLKLVCGSPARVDAAKGFEARLELHSKGHVMDRFLLDFGVMLMGEKPISAKVMWLASATAARAVRWLSLKQRGKERSQWGWICSRFPLGLFSFRAEQRIEHEIGVLPAERVPKEMDLCGFFMDGLPMSGMRRAVGTGEWKGLRGWRSGDSVRSIAWPASIRSHAAGGSLLVRQDEPPGFKVSACAVVFHSFGRDRDLIRPDRFERALSLLCGVIGMLVDEGVPVCLLTDFWDWDEIRIDSRRRLAGLKERLMSVKRADWVEAHDVSEAFARIETQRCLIVISDMPLGSWEHLVPRTVSDAVTVNIEKQEKSARRKFQTGKAVFR
ncbi:MAG: hypothetical protein RL346_1977 [Verrucomicrobiota bacterium]